MEVRMPVRGLVFLLSLFSATVTAQAPTPQSTAGQQLPPRDNQAKPQSGTAVMKGRITAADSGRPLRRARINATAPELGSRGREVSTDADGRYEIRELPAGRYTVTVTRSGYLTLRYGQRRPLEQGRLLDVAQGQSIDNIDFMLPKMSVIRGRVTDELGEPIEGANVFAMHVEYWNGRRRVVPGSQVSRTDDADEYRLTGLMPGTYWVMATLRETWTEIENGKPVQLGYAPTYLPGVTNITDAQRVVIRLGEVASAQDFSLLPGRTAKVSGTVTDSRGRPLAGGNVGLSQETVGRAGGMFQSAGGATIAADGTFVISNVAPGEYKISAYLRLSARKS
jgi:protocatechuate 3,4-dioxygenase beta subunit